MTDLVPGTKDGTKDTEERFEQDFGEPLHEVLDLSTWSGQADIQTMYDRLEREVAQAVAQEGQLREAIREGVFPQLLGRRNAPKTAGVWQLDVDDIQRAQEGTLFAGDVEAATGTSYVLDSLQLTVIQVGVCLLKYRGDERTWEHRVLRRDVAGTGVDPVQEAIALIEQRQHQDNKALHTPDRLTELATRGITSVAERAALAREATAMWRMGSGQPAPFEILSGAGSLDVVIPGLQVLRELLLDHKRFVFVQRSPRKRALLTIGLALRPLEFAIVHEMRTYIEDMVVKGHLRDDYRVDALDFVKTAGREVVVGIYRVSETGPPYVFYAPADEELCMQAATLAMADAVLQEHVAYPLLLDLANRIGGQALGQTSVKAATQAAFHAHGYAPMGAE